MSLNDNKSLLGAFLADQLSAERLRTWRIIFFLLLALIALMSLIIKNLHPHFGFDAYPFFWPIFGLVVGLVLIFVVKKIIQPIIKRTEDHYGDL
ncbi:MAG: hypothetical protein LBV23_10395 [Deltaproteobacteria bacterium]|jgi:membrane protein YdbS with pleckstrin-like domain|nr:hypothetical protein [Deltaproteobacteria bacterium]